MGGTDLKISMVATTVVKKAAHHCGQVDCSCSKSYSCIYEIYIGVANLLKTGISVRLSYLNAYAINIKHNYKNVHLFIIIIIIFLFFQSTALDATHVR